MASWSQTDVPILRRALDGVYLFGAFLGAGFVVAIGLVITAQVVSREFGQQVRGADDITAWSVAAAAFLPLLIPIERTGTFVLRC